MPAAGAGAARAAGMETAHAEDHVDDVGADTRHDVRARARLVYECFVSDEAPHQICISGHTRTKIEAALGAGGSGAGPSHEDQVAADAALPVLPLDVFDNAASYAFSQLITSQWPLFQAKVGSRADFDHLIAVMAATASDTDSRALGALLREREAKTSAMSEQAE